ncbi:MAG: aspartate carbamoyltransferase [Bdellovibrionaceae bacterium]|nr:aspartate carbamoyltransferase [Pseudobdellovibrionaceae bacterium]|tara:strand:+ start:202 stop:1125 length:924 start_codon:yes stop_codon:yes gene_type:complete
MPSIGPHLFSTDQLDREILTSLFGQASQFKQSWKVEEAPSLREKVVFLVFLEPSTRTRMSFEIACHRLNAKPSVFSNSKNTSLVKGESILDTLKVLEAMGPDLIVLRSSQTESVKSHILQANCRYINAGSGSDEHPTQALLDAFTMNEKLGTLSGKNILFLGDVRHSRVANSNIILLEKLGANIGFCSPSFFRPEGDKRWMKAESFEKLQPALEWADVCIALRVQKERHSEKTDQNISEFVTYYQLNRETIKWLGPESYIMHPGPFVPNEEITYDVVNDSRSLILNQVENGVFVRAALLKMMLGEGG